MNTNTRRPAQKENQYVRPRPALVPGRGCHAQSKCGDEGNSSAITELKEFPGRSHSLTIASGWRELAEYILSWLNAKGF